MPIDPVVAEFEAAEGRSPPSDPIELEFAELEASKPAFTPASSADSAAVSADVAHTLKATQLLEPITPNLSVIDDFHMRVREAGKGALEAQKLAKSAHGKIGYGTEDLTSEFTFDDFLAHAAQAGVGDVWKVAYNPKAKRDCYDTANRRRDQFMKAKGYTNIATPEETAEIGAAFLFGEIAYRAPMLPATLEKSTHHALQTLLAEQRQLAVEHGAVTTEVANAMAYLNDLTPQEAVQVRGYMASHSDRVPQNEQEAALTKERFGGYWPHGWEIAQPPGTASERPPARAFSALQTILGTRNPNDNVLNLMARTDATFKAKDLGFINGDLSRPGVRLPDANAPGGFVDVDLVPPDTLAAIERRKNEHGLTTPWDIKTTPVMVSQMQSATGLPMEEAAKLVENAAAAEGARAAQLAGMGSHQDSVAGAQTFTATEWDALSPLSKLKERLSQTTGPALKEALQPFDMWREQQKGTQAEVIAQRVIYAFSGDEYLAQQADSLNDIVSIGMGLVTQYSQLREGVNATQAAALTSGDYNVPPVVERNASYDRALQAKLFKDATGFMKMWSSSPVREDARKEEEGRQARMSTAERTGFTNEYGRLHYYSDLWTSGLHNVFEGLGAAAAQVIDKPEHIPIVLGLNKGMDFLAAGGMGAMQRAASAAISSQNAGAAMQKILRFAPHEVERLRTVANRRLEEAVATGSQPRMVQVLQDLEAHATTLQREWEGVRAGGRAPTGEAIDRVASLWRSASAMGVDFESVGDLARSMQPRGLVPQVAEYLRRKVGLPQYLTPDGLRGLSKSYQELGNRLNASLGRAPTDVIEATELERLAQGGDVNAAAKLAELQQGHTRTLGVSQRLELYGELETMIDDLKAGRSADNKRFQEVRTKLWGETAITDLDYATLTQISEAKRYAPDGPVGKLMAKMFGHSPAQLEQIANAGRRTLDFAAQDAQDLYLAKLGSEVRNARGNKAYAFAQERVKIKQAELEREYLGRPQDEAYAARAKALTELPEQLNVEQRRSQTNPVTSSWALDNKMLMQVLTDDDLATIAELDPVLFGGAKRADFVSKRVGTDGEWISPESSKELRALFEKPSLEAQVGQFKALGRAEHLVELEQTIRQHRARPPAELTDLEMEELADAQAARKDLRKEIKLDRKRAMREIGLQKEDYSAEVAGALLGAELNGYGTAGMPFWGVSKALHELPRTAARRQASWMLRINDLHTELDHLRSTFDPAVGAELDKAIRSGRLGGTLADYPELRAKFEAVYPTGDATRAGNLEKFLNNAETFRVDMLEDARAAGRIDKHTYNHLVEQGYDPHRYGVHEVSRLVRDDKLQAMRRGMKPSKGATSQVGPKNETLMFQRDMFKHRVRVREADGFIRDETFRTEALARDWVRRTYGSDAEGSLKSAADGFREGKTASGDRIVLADPIGKEGLEVLGISTKTPELMLKSFADTIRDQHQYLLLNSLRSTGLVLDELEHAQLFNRFGSSGADFASQFRRLPNDPARLGNMSGKYVHRKVFSELNNYSHSFDQFRSWVEGITDTFQAAGTAVPDELINAAPGKVGKVYRGVTRAVKTAGILTNHATWAGNVLFNVTLSYLNDGEVFACKNWDSWKLAMREIWSGPKTRAQLYARSRLYREFVEDGFSQGKAFDTDIHAPSVRNMMRAFDLDDPAKVRANITKYEQLSKELEQRLALGEHPKNLEPIQLHLASLRAVLDEYEKGMGRRIVQKLGGFFLGNKNLLGLPNSKLAKTLGAAYGNVDETFKFVNYINLRKRMSRGEAKWNIEQHFQDYSKVPYAIGSMSTNPMGALVPSFPFEMMRLTRNLLKNKPLKTLALMSMVPAINMLSAGVSGIDDDRVTAVLHQAGHRNAWERIKAKATELRLWNPVTKEPLATVSLFNLLPFTQITEGKGVLAQAADSWFPEEDRTVGTGLLAEGMSAVANFVGNNPLTNTVGVAAFNRDPLTGQQVLDTRNARPSHWLQAGFRHLARQFIPRAGMLLADLEQSARAPIDPTTGKPVGAPHWTELLSASVGVRIKGLSSMFEQRAKVKGRPIGSDEALVKSAMYAVIEKRGGEAIGYPQFGVENDIRWYTAALQDPRTSPEARASYEKELKELMHRERSVNVLGREHKLSTTERQEWMAADRLEQRGVPSLFLQATPEEQALIMTWVDRGGARSDTLGELINLATRTRTGRPIFEKDPESLQKALAVIQQRLSEPGADTRLGALKGFWTATQGKAAGMYRKERGRREGQKAAGVR